MTTETQADITGIRTALERIDQTDPESWLDPDPDIAVAVALEAIEDGRDLEPSDDGWHAAMVRALTDAGWERCYHDRHARFGVHYNVKDHAGHGWKAASAVTNMIGRYALAEVEIEYTTIERIAEEWVEVAYDWEREFFWSEVGNTGCGASGGYVQLPRNGDVAGVTEMAYQARAVLDSDDWWKWLARISLETAEANEGDRYALEPVAKYGRRAEDETREVFDWSALWGDPFWNDDDEGSE